MSSCQTKLIYTTVCCVLLSICIKSEAIAQRRQPPPLYQRSSLISLQATNLLSLSNGRLDVSYRVPTNFFIFIRNTSSVLHDQFLAKAEVTLEILDSSNNSLARDFRIKEIMRKDPPPSDNDTSYLVGISTFTVTPGNYTLVFEISDVESARKYRDTKKVTVRDYSTTNLEFSDIVFLEEAPNQSAKELLPLNFGGDLLFGKHASAFVQLLSKYTIDSLRITYTILKMNTEMQSQTAVVNDSLSPKELSIASILKVHEQEHHYTYVPNDSSLSHCYSMTINLPADTFEQGSYTFELTVALRNETKKISQAFHVRWIGMPASLRQLTFAIDAMQYIMNEQEFKQLKAADPVSQHLLFETFWKQRDPTPNTVFNEAMAEYFKRVDYAFSSFVTIKQNNGMKTERGKAYILYGPPAKIERNLSPSSFPQEVWYYTNLQRKLIFIDQSHTGDYKLLSTEPF